MWGVEVGAHMCGIFRFIHFGDWIHICAVHVLVLCFCHLSNRMTPSKNERPLILKLQLKVTLTQAIGVYVCVESAWGERSVFKMATSYSPESCHQSQIPSISKCWECTLAEKLGQSVPKCWCGQSMKITACNQSVCVRRCCWHFQSSQVTIFLIEHRFILILAFISHISYLHKKEQFLNLVGKQLYMSVV